MENDPTPADGEPPPKSEETGAQGAGAQGAGAQGAGAKGRSSRKPGSDKSRTILMVDDDTSIRDLVAVLLEAEGYTVLKAKHSQEALLFDQEFNGTIHLLLTDFLMRPFPNGYQLAKQIRRHRPDIRVMYISGYVEDDSLQREVDAFEAVFLPKPFSPKALIECVRKALEVKVSGCTPS